MTSNHTFICVPCRKVVRRERWLTEVAIKTYRWKRGATSRQVGVSYGICPVCGGRMQDMYNWSPPKKNDERAWKRIESGEYLWDRRRTKRGRRPNSTSYRTNHNPDMGA